jgi:hypothetical protein
MLHNITEFCTAGINIRYNRLMGVSKCCAQQMIVNSLEILTTGATKLNYISRVYLFV